MWAVNGLMVRTMTGLPLSGDAIKIKSYLYTDLMFFTEFFDWCISFLKLMELLFLQVNVCYKRCFKGIYL